MVARNRHWSARLLSYGGRVQLIRSILFVVANYWMQCFPLPKKVLQHVESLCRTFLWNGIDVISRKSPIAWDDVCKLIKAGGLNLISLGGWNKANLLMLLRNLSGKADSLWVRWINSYYITIEDIMTAAIPASCSWILKRDIEVPTFGAKL